MVLRSIWDALVAAYGSDTFDAYVFSDALQSRTSRTGETFSAEDLMQFLNEVRPGDTGYQYSAVRRFLREAKEEGQLCRDLKLMPILLQYQCHHRILDAEQELELKAKNGMLLDNLSLIPFETVVRCKIEIKLWRNTFRKFKDGASLLEVLKDAKEQVARYALEREALQEKEVTFVGSPSELPRLLSYVEWDHHVRIWGDIVDSLSFWNTEEDTCTT